MSILRLRLSPSGPFIPFQAEGIVEPTCATLTARIGQDVDLGATARVLDIRAYYVLTDDGAAALALDFPNVLKTSLTSVTSRWQRLDFPDLFWQSQATWFIDPDNGNDEANGLTLATAIKSWREFMQRTGGVLVTPAPATVTITLVGTGVWNGDPLLGTLNAAGGATIAILGSKQAQSANGATVSAAVQNPGASTPSDFDGGPGLGAFGGQTIETATGKFARIMAPTGIGDLLIVTPWTDIAGAATAAPAALETFTVSPSLTGVINLIDIAEGTTVLFDNLDNLALHSGGAGQGTYVHNLLVSTGGGKLDVVNCMYLGNYMQGLFLGGGLQFADSNGSTFLDAGGEVLLLLGNHIEIDQLGVELGALCLLMDVGAWASVTVAMKVDSGARVVAMGLLYGGNATHGLPLATIGLQVLNSAKFYVANGGTTPSITGTTELNVDALPGYVNTPIPTATIATVPNVWDATACPTWAAWAAAPFTGNLVNLITGSLIGSAAA